MFDKECQEFSFSLEPCEANTINLSKYKLGISPFRGQFLIDPQEHYVGLVLLTPRNEVGSDMFCINACF